MIIVLFGIRFLVFLVWVCLRLLVMFFVVSLLVVILVCGLDGLVMLCIMLDRLNFSICLYLVLIRLLV